MASLSSARALLPAAHGVPAAALKAAATSGASFLVVYPAGARAKAVVAALQAATKGAGLVLSTRVVACAAKGGDEEHRTSEDAEGVIKASDVFFVGAGEDNTDEEVTKDDAKAFYIVASEEITSNDAKAFGGGNRAGEEVTKDDSKAFCIGASEEVTKDDSKAFYIGASEEVTKDDYKAFYIGASEEVAKDDSKAFGGGDRTGTGEEDTKDDSKAFYFGASGDRTGKDLQPTKDVVSFGSGEMSIEELAGMFQKETAMLLKQVKFFPMGDGDYEDVIPDMIAACDSIGNQLLAADSPEGRTIVHQRLIALHFRIVSCAGGVEEMKAGSYMPAMWVGYRHRLPSKEKRAGTLMEILLYSMMLAEAALAPFVSAPKELDFRNFD